MSPLVFQIILRDAIMSTVEENKRLMQTLDDAWNSQDWETFDKRHASHVDVFWPGQADPTHGRLSHREEAIAFFKIFPDNRVGNRPYKVLFGQEDWTCSVAEFTGTFKGPMTTPDGKVIEPNGKKFSVEFCTVAHWKDEEIIEEKLFYDKISLMQQIGLM
ncbi:ester cyclase [Methanosphaerula palustris]|nr:ester cyclase [Methanosphaerula palustris]